VDQVSGFGIGPTQQFDGDGGLLGSVATLEPSFKRLQFLDGEFTRRLRRHHHGITTTNDDSAPTTTTNIQQQQTSSSSTSITTPSVLLNFFCPSNFFLFSSLLPKTRGDVDWFIPA
jgi:hypothetical protein